MGCDHRPDGDRVVWVKQLPRGISGALAPIATDMAANSDSTLTNSQRSRRRAATGSRVRIAIVDAAEGNDRRAGALGAEARKRLGMPSFIRRGDGEHLGGSDDPLAAASVNANLECVS